MTYPVTSVVVVPTLNEVENIGSLLHRLLSLQSAPDVLIVDDNSTDGTQDVVAAAATGSPRVRLHVRDRRTGLAGAYVDGFFQALEGRYNAIVQMDADGSHEVDDVDRLIAKLAEADLVIGSRYVRGGQTVGWAAYRRALSRAGNVYARNLLSIGVRDLTGGFKAWRAETLRSVDLGQIRASGYGFQIETTFRAVRAGASVVEVPITFRERSAGHSKMSTRIAFEALRVVPSMRFGRLGRQGA